MRGSKRKEQSSPYARVVSGAWERGKVGVAPPASDEAERINNHGY